MIMDDLVGEVSGEADKFPVDLRVLVVDDDLCCLKVAEVMLQKCKYNVTTTTRPLEALKMLRDDKNRFNIVITEVSMREMDGFKLLEVIENEIGIPVIMLSAHDETKYVMKGIQHRACDYLVKPARMLELQKIWRHVIKRKNMSEKDKNNPNQVEEQGSTPSENRTIENTESCNDSKVGQKRKGQYEEVDETKDGPTSTQKKSRVVWSSELHQKFLAIVNHLTTKEAVPKKILALMNVKGLTRENVASHLQKYRLYMKRSEPAENKQENSMQMRSMEGFGSQEAQRFPTNPISSTPSSGLLCIYNCPQRMNMDVIAPPTLIHQNTSQFTHNSFGQPTKLSQNQLSELFEGNPRSFEFDHINNLSGFSYPATFPNNEVGLASSINLEPRNSVNQRIMRETPLKSESYCIGTRVASNLSSHQEAHLCEFSSTLFRSLETRCHHATPMNSSRLFHVHSPISSPLMTAVQTTQPNFLADLSCQEGRLGNVVQNVSCSQRSNGEEQIPVLGHNTDHSALPLADGIMDNNIMESVNDHDSMVSFRQLNTIDESLEDPNMTFDPCDFLDIPLDGLHPSNFDTSQDLPYLVNGEHNS